jgi:lipid-binding SYLF domain-containing protein
MRLLVLSALTAALRRDMSDNRELYGGTLENREIIAKEAPAPAPADKFVSLLNKYSGRS